MTHTVIRHSKGEDVWLTEPGTYRRAKVDGRMTATMSCPTCGQVASLSGHTINPGGHVNPSLVCPYEGCGFHEYVTLEGWTP